MTPCSRGRYVYQYIHKKLGWRQALSMFEMERNFDKPYKDDRGIFSDAKWFLTRFDGKIRLETDLNIYSTSQIAVVNK